MKPTESQTRMFSESNEKEEYLLKWLASMSRKAEPINPRWASIAKTHFEEGFMALNKAIAGGGRTER